MTTETHWEDEASGYDSVMSSDPALAALHDAILNWVPSGVAPLLDLGCGTGALLLRIARRDPEQTLIGLDPSVQMLEIARERVPQCLFVEASAERIPLADGDVGIVISNFALHHLTHEAKREAAKEIARVLRPGGLLVFGDQHIPIMGTPDDPVWQESVLNLFTEKARFYLRNASAERALLQIRLLPRFLQMDGEIPATVAYWRECLEGAGLEVQNIIATPPEALYNRVIIAQKPV